MDTYLKKIWDCNHYLWSQGIQAWTEERRLLLSLVVAGSLPLSQTLEDNMTPTFMLIFSSWLEHSLPLNSDLPKSPKAMSKPEKNPK